MRPGFYPILILCLVKGILSAVIPTSQKTSISPYSFPLGMIDPQIHYSFYKDYTNQDMAKQGFYYISDSEIIYLARRTKLEAKRFKLVRVSLSTFTQDTYPTSSSNFLTFEGLDIYGFTMPQFPNIDGIIAVNTTSFCLEYCTLDSSTYAVKTCYSISKFCLESVPLIYPSIPEYKYQKPIIVKVVKNSGTTTSYTVFIYLGWSGNDQSAFQTLYKFDTSLGVLKGMRNLNELMDFQDMILVTPTDPETDVITAFHDYSEYSQRDISNTNLGQINIGNTKQVCLRIFETERMNIRWSGCYGTQYDNAYGSLSVFGNKIYLLYSSSTSTFGSTSQDMLLTIINLRTGVEVSTKIYGSTSNESTLDIVVNHFGIFMMANIGNGFKLNGATDSYSTQNSNTNFALIYADYFGNIIEIESYDTTSSSNSLGANYPKKLIITRQNKQDPFYLFISTRDDGTTNQGGGVFITKIANQQALFVTGNTNAACNALSPNCQLCHNQYCFKCLDGYLIQNGVCKSNCDNYFYYQHNDADNTKDINICLPCYETCKTCSGTTKTFCLGCDADKTYDSTYNTCKCITSGSTNLLGLNGVCVSTCDYGLTSTKQNECMRSCPEDSEDYSSSIDTTARAKSTGINCYNLSKHLHFTSGVTKGYQVQIYESRQYQLFTTTFWVYISSTSANEIILHSFESFYIKIIKDTTISTNNLSLRLDVTKSDLSTTSFSTGNAFSLNEWAYIGVSFYKTIRINETYEINLVVKTKANVITQQSFTKQTLTFSCYQNVSSSAIPFVVFGAENTTSTSKFTGYMNLILRYQEPQSIVEMLSNSNRSPIEYANIYEPHLKAAFIVKDISSVDYTNKFYDFATYSISYSVGTDSSTVQMISLPSDTINVCYSYIQNQCKSVDTTNMPTLLATEDHIFNFIGISSDSSFTFALNDSIILNADSKFSNLVPYYCYPGDYQLQANFGGYVYDGTKFQNNAISNVPNGYFSIATNQVKGYYFRAAAGDLIYFGSFSVLETVPSVSPDHGQYKLGTSNIITFTLTYNPGGVSILYGTVQLSGYNEYISFSLDCDNVQSTDIKLQRQSDGTFPSLDTSSITSTGDYLICWKPPYISYNGYIRASDSYFTIVGPPTVSTSVNNTFNLNQDYVSIYLEGTIGYQDQYQLFTGSTDCDSASPVGDTITNQKYNWIDIWFPDIKYYLFGDQVKTTVHYIHYLYVKNYFISSQSSTNNIYTYLKDTVFGFDIGTTLSSYLSLNLYKTNAEINSYSTSKPSISIHMTLTSTPSSCTAPTAIINLQNIIGTVLYATNLDLKNCPVGNSIYANFEISFNSFYSTHIKTDSNIFLGKIGCDSSCQECTGHRNSDCQICSSTNPYYYPDMGICNAGPCNNVFVNYENTFTYNSVSYIKQYCLTDYCPAYYYKTNENICSRCYSGCIKCQDAFLEDCSQCDFPTPFLLDTTCVNSCPSDLYNYDYSTYQCVKNDYYDSAVVSANSACQTSNISSKDNLSVKILLNGVSSSLMSSAGGVLSMSITNKRGSINYNKFVQIEPTPNPSDALTNLFPLISGSTNQYVNETTIVELNPSTIKNYAVGTLFKVMAEVHNDCGDISRGYISFALSMTPTIGDAAITCTSTPCKIQETMTITLTGNWYNTEVLLMELYVKVEFKLSDGTVILIYPENWQKKTFSFTLPVISTTSSSSIPVSVLITATNIYDKSATLTKSVTIDNTLSSGYRSTLYSASTNYQDLQSIILFGAQMKLTLSVPSNTIQNQDLCQQDRDCSNQGECIKERNGNYCNCDEGYSEIDCSMDSHEYSRLKQGVSLSLKYLSQYLTTSSLIGRKNVEDQFVALSYICVRPEFIDFTYISQIAQIIKTISDLGDSTILALPDSFISAFINTVTSFYVRVKYEYNVNMKKQNATEYFISLNMYSYSSKISDIQSDSTDVWIACERYMSRISIKATSINTILSYETVVGLFKVEYRLANTISGTTYTINSGKNYNIVFPSNLFDSTSISSTTAEVRILAVTWYINPIPLSEFDTYKYGSNTVSIYLLNYNRDIVSITGKSIYVSMQYDKSFSYFSSTEVCSSWDINLSTNKLISSSCNVSFTGTSTAIFSECNYCSKHYIAVISSTHLSSFCITVPTSYAVQTSTINGIGRKHSAPSDIPKIEESIGFYFICSLSGIFMLGLFIIIPVEFLKLKKKLN